MPTIRSAVPSVFQSTLPARGATKSSGSKTAHSRISIHAPREGSDGCVPFLAHSQGISIHAPREGSDNAVVALLVGGNISIHAPREGSDGQVVQRLHLLADFNPRSPRGERLLFTLTILMIWKFQSTLPARGATAWVGWLSPADQISIHAPREGSDVTG